MLHECIFKLVIHTSQKRNLWKTSIIEGKVSLFRDILIKSIAVVGVLHPPVSGMRGCRLRAQPCQTNRTAYSVTLELSCGIKQTNIFSAFSPTPALENDSELILHKA